MNIVLCGMPASGKTTVARVLSEKYGLVCVDTDAMIAAKHGIISEIFASEGETKFRDYESEAAEDASRLENAVIATGGGCILRGRNVAALKQSGKIIYLRANEAPEFERARGCDDRPLLAGDMRAEIAALADKRASLYAAAADFTVDVDSLSPEETAEKIMEFIKK